MGKSMKRRSVAGERSDAFSDAPVAGMREGRLSDA
jgi:hypothetical protein